jgi:hypothetical protein
VQSARKESKVTSASLEPLARKEFKVPKARLGPLER